MRKPIPIPVVAAAAEQVPPASNCDGNEIVALMVLGDSMAPEFSEGEIIVIQMGLPAREGAFVIGTLDDEPILRQLQRDAHGGWLLHPLNPAYADAPIADLSGIRGVIMQKRKPGSRKSVKRYDTQAA
ncbi:MAG: S24 family peptidase [Pseudomonadota bacterium]